MGASQSTNNKHSSASADGASSSSSTDAVAPPMTASTTSLSPSAGDSASETTRSQQQETTITTEKVEYHSSNKSRSKQRAPSGLSGMPLVNYVCRKKKKRYDECVKDWYSREFMTGAGNLNQEEVCGDIFESYRQCVLKGIKKEFFEKEGRSAGVGSALSEIDDDED